MCVCLWNWQLFGAGTTILTIFIWAYLGVFMSRGGTEGGGGRGDTPYLKYFIHIP